MGDEIPLSIFKTYDTGLKLYLDSDCTIEEKFDDSDKLNPFYTISLDSLRLGKTKQIIRYVKNIGINQSLYSMYTSSEYNVKVEFVDGKGEKYEYANGLLHSQKANAVLIEITPLLEDSMAKVNLHLAGRELKFN